MKQYTEDEANAVVLDSFEELTYKIKAQITERFAFSVPDKKYAPFLIKTLGEGVYNKIRGLFSSSGYRAKVMASLESKGIRCITYFSEEYPEKLKNIPAPPLVLYCKGNAALLSERSFAIVGSRRTLPEILKECRKISSQAAQKFAIVTGTADGADTAAACGAEGSGRLILVAAQGLDHVYPASNAKLYRRAAEKGLLLSEQRPSQEAKAYLFPVRNRIIAALSEGVLVVSAGERSGASITAEYAFEYGKDVFCFPYSVGIPSGAGCNRLIKKGAYLAENILDIFRAYGLDFTTRGQPELGEKEQKILSVLRQTGTAHVSEIAASLGLQSYEILAVLSSLEVKGLAARVGGNRFSALN